MAGFTKTVALETAQAGNVTCNAICPGYVLTDLIRNQLEDTAKARGIPKAHSIFLLRSTKLLFLTKCLAMFVWQSLSALHLHVVLGWLTNCRRRLQRPKCREWHAPVILTFSKKLT